MIANSIVQLDQNQAVLDALPDALFRWEIASGLLRPLNKPAVQLAGGGRVESVAFRDCFPEASIAATENSLAHWSLTRFVSPQSGMPRDVTFQVRDLDRVEGSRLLIVRALATGSPAIDGSPVDAFDDAFHDPLTRLPNRRLFERRLQRAVARTERGYHFAVLFVDLDDFKNVNDRFGHLSGDRVLVAAAHRLVESVRPQDMVARRDGDEFTILLDDLAQREDAMRVAERIVEQVRKPLSLEVDGRQSEVAIGVSIGIATSHGGELDAVSLLSRADTAMYQAKAMGGGTSISLETAATSSSRPKPLPR